MHSRHVSPSDEDHLRAQVEGVRDAVKRCLAPHALSWMVRGQGHVCIMLSDSQGTIERFERVDLSNILDFSINMSLLGELGSDTFIAA